MTSYFGTDGIRSRVGQGVMTAHHMLQIGWATGMWLADKLADQQKESQQKALVVIGKDTRQSGYMFESALEAGLIAAGVDVLLTGPMPTPAIAWLTVQHQADAGIVISASHNPHFDNGVKFFSETGHKISAEDESRIEYWMEQPGSTVPSEMLGKARRLDQAMSDYVSACLQTAQWGDERLDLKGLKLVLDCAHGATYHLAPAVFEQLGAKVIAIGVDPSGLNINQHCGATDLTALVEKVQMEQADLGIAFDGDGDRVMMVSAKGEVADGDVMLLALVLGSEQKPKGVAGTLMSNMALELRMKAEGVDFVRTAVGDKYVMRALVQQGWHYGAEPSGHILCLDQASTGDGIVAAIQVLKALSCMGKTLAELMETYHPMPQKLVNVRVSDLSLQTHPAFQEAIAQAEASLNHHGRVLVRKSGTEPLIRIMVEAHDEAVVDRISRQLADLLESLS